MGKPCSLETREKIHEALVGNPRLRTFGFLGRHHNKKTREKIKRGLAWVPKEVRQEWASRSFLGRHHTDDARRRISEKLTGRRLSAKTKRKLSLVLKGNPLLATRGFAGHHHTDDWKEKRAELVKGWWRDENYRNKTVKSILRSLCKRPNKCEILLLSILDRLFPGEFKYVGNGQFILGGKCPDFMNVNGKKVLVELFGDHWHKGEDPRVRINFFRKYGYKTVVVWERELRDVEKLNKRLVSLLGVR